MMIIRGVRGATTVEQNDAEEILGATRELLEALIEANNIEEDYVASVLFSTTPDLTAAYPAKAARMIGWRQVALMGCQEAAVPGGLPKCVRILLHWNTDKSSADIRHIYIRGAEVLRPDLSKHENGF